MSELVNYRAETEWARERHGKFSILDQYFKKRFATKTSDVARPPTPLARLVSRSGRGLTRFVGIPNKQKHKSRSLHMFFSGCTLTGFSNPEISENTFYLPSIGPLFATPEEKHPRRRAPCMCASDVHWKLKILRAILSVVNVLGEREIVLSESCLPNWGDGREKKLKLMARGGGGSVQQRKHAIIFCNALPPAMFPRKWTLNRRCCCCFAFLGERVRSSRKGHQKLDLLYTPFHREWRHSRHAVWKKIYFSEISQENPKLITNLNRWRLWTRTF